jgi:hypothetical protein
MPVTRMIPSSSMASLDAQSLPESRGGDTTLMALDDRDNGALHGLKRPAPPGSTRVKARG